MSLIESIKQKLSRNKPEEVEKSFPSIVQEMINPLLKDGIINPDDGVAALLYAFTMVARDNLGEQDAIQILKNQIFKVRNG